MQGGSTRPMGAKRNADDPWRGVQGTEDKQFAVLRPHNRQGAGKKSRTFAF